MFLRWIPDRSSSSLSPVLCYPRADPPWTCWRVSSLAESVLRPSLHSLRFLLNAASHTFFQLLLMFFPTAVTVGGSSLQKLKFPFRLLPFPPSLVDVLLLPLLTFFLLHLLTFFSFTCRLLSLHPLTLSCLICWRSSSSLVDTLLLLLSTFSLLLLTFSTHICWRSFPSIVEVFYIHLLTSSPIVWWHFPPPLDDVFPFHLMTFSPFTWWRFLLHLLTYSAWPFDVLQPQSLTFSPFACWHFWPSLSTFLSIVESFHVHLLTLFPSTCCAFRFTCSPSSPSFTDNFLLHLLIFFPSSHLPVAFVSLESSVSGANLPLCAHSPIGVQPFHG